MNRNKMYIWKNISYVILPICIILLIISGMKISYNMEYPDDKNETDFFNTNQFANIYESSICSNLMRMEQVKNQINTTNERYYYENRIITTNENGYEGLRIYYNKNSNNNFKYLIIDKESKVAYTNVNLTMESDTIEEIKNIIQNNTYYWNVENKEINTNIEKLSLSKLMYGNTYNEYVENYIMYTGISEELIFQDQYDANKKIYNMMNFIKNDNAYFIFPVISIMTIWLFVVIIIGIGKKNEDENITLNWFDKLPLLVSILIILFIIAFGSCFLTLLSIDNWSIKLTAILIAITIYYITFIISIETFIKRIKSRTLIKNTVIYKFLKFIVKIIKNIFYRLNVSFRVIGIAIAIIIVHLILFSMEAGGILILIALWISSIYWIIKKLNNFEKIREQIKQIYEGNTKNRLNIEEFKGEQKEIAGYVNDIAGGFSNAIEKSLKTERLKTELITNVSHDIKTPLTSIINYVDLIKKENIDNEKVQEYLEVLDNKSQRLKKLTEDLVEASKASSGNIKLNIEKLNINEMMKQVCGEFEDRFTKKSLQTILNLDEKDNYILADSRYLYRVLENLFSNISKYALDGSRVYIDVLDRDNNIGIELKNISKEKLNISPDELMQRFVRGDSSRNTEGSGLGLSIAQSLIQLQSGKFILYLDGDLFKVCIELRKAK